MIALNLNYIVTQIYNYKFKTYIIILVYRLLYIQFSNDCVTIDVVIFPATSTMIRDELSQSCKLLFLILEE